MFFVTYALSNRVDNPRAYAKLAENLLQSIFLVLYFNYQFENPQYIGDKIMDTNKNYTKEELLEYIKLLEKTIKVQNDTINRMLDAYILNNKTSENVSN